MVLHVVAQPVASADNLSETMESRIRNLTTDYAQYTHNGMDRQLRQVSQNQKLSTAKSTKLAKQTQSKPLAPLMVEEPVPIGKLAKTFLFFFANPLRSLRPLR